MKILVDAIPMTGLLTGIARYLRNLYTTIEHLNLARTAYFTGKAVAGSLPPLAPSRKWQQTTQSVRHLPDPVVFGIRAARWLWYEHTLNRICRNRASGITLYHETAFTPAKLTTVPTVYSVYDLSLRRYKDTHPKERVWLFAYFIKTRLKYARHILTISEFIRKEIMEEFKVPPHMVSSVPLAPDPLFAPCTSAAVNAVKKKYNLPHDYLVFVSSLEPRKNISLLMDALAAAKTDIPLVLVGWHGWGDKDWLAKTNAGVLKDRVFFTGHVPDQDLKAVYTGAAALVYPSLYEGFGLPIVEAMACGCPVICSDTASMPEVAGDAALLIDPHRSDSLAHAIDTMVHDTGVRTSFIQKGFGRAGQFTWEKTARQTIDIFSRVQ
ncbi:MAG: glycosyltransferase family 1 protein [Desulfotignum sp.]|jgi:alpha-1,3-rhamnosyl/mannosyltransferase|nr:glycosyltransferase family 1 protein [Desulfotignum sp.]